MPNGTAQADRRRPTKQHPVVPRLDAAGRVVLRLRSHRRPRRRAPTATVGLLHRDPGAPDRAALRPRCRHAAAAKRHASDGSATVRPPGLPASALHVGSERRAHGRHDAPAPVRIAIHASQFVARDLTRSCRAATYRSVPSFTLPRADAPQLPPPMLRARCARATGRSCCCRCGWRRASSRSPMAAASCACASIPTRFISTRTSPSSPPTEQTWGTHYWEQDWRAGDDARRAGDAWRQLADRFGAQRAAWIARVLQPTNLRNARQRRPRRTSRCPSRPCFAAIAVATMTAGAGATRRRRALLPDRWIAVVHSGGRPALTVTGTRHRAAARGRPRSAGRRPTRRPSRDRRG